MDLGSNPKLLIIFLDSVLRFFAHTFAPSRRQIVVNSSKLSHAAIQKLSQFLSITVIEYQLELLCAVFQFGGCKFLTISWRI